ncbi:AAA-like domain-containing protein [Microcoleus sp. FACHB-1515]|uniref:AAA-like domain-containing protein n=1 Tax=Cyanophyceae TaxID=3028117 RepID=UPI001688EDD1|nr:AAA-like domain-containing protein [Microcoleus sp. FACHB-1515]MBD2092605.1 AAA-like domain-containing protein [Microcoleus sp. FACHB-1515]
MDIDEALAFADRLILERTGKPLSDLERKIFVGSWEGQSYRTIYPANPHYVEKQVGYKLWQKLSTALGEKVKKKQFRGALERQLRSLSDRADLPMQSVFIGYRNQAPDRTLAEQIHQAIAAARHHAVLVDVDTSPTASGWLNRLEEQLAQCSHFILLLSPEAAVSEMLVEALRRATELHDSHHTEPLAVVPIWINCALDLPMNYDLCSYLPDDRSHQWRSPDDTPRLVQDLLNLLSGQQIDRSCSPIPSQPPIRNAAYPAPVPTADPEIPQGQVRLHSQFYVERVPDEAQCYREIRQPGTLIRIKAPRQMGKTSLMSRILYRAKEQGYRTVSLSFQHADKAVFASLDRLLQWFCTRITRKLHLPHHVDQYWSDLYGSKDNCNAYFEDCLLPEIDAPLVLGLDEVDRVFEHPNVADDFFGLLRAWYEEAGYGDDRGLWEKLRMVVVHSTEVYIPLDVNQSPFNVGLPIELTEFSPAQVQDLVQRHRLNWRSLQIEQLMQMVGGHPYLVRLALYHLVQHQLSLEQLLATAPTEAGIYGDHLRGHLWRLQQHPALAAAFGEVAIAPAPIELESLLAFKLHSMGLVQMQGNQTTPRFELYRQYFRDRLANSN